MIIRLQGIDYHYDKHQLQILSWSESKNGRIRIELRGHKGTRYCHWLNPEEQAAFDKTKYPITKFKGKRTKKNAIQ